MHTDHSLWRHLRLDVQCETERATVVCRYNASKVVWCRQSQAYQTGDIHTALRQGIIRMVYILYKGWKSCCNRREGVNLTGSIWTLIYLILTLSWCSAVLYLCIHTYIVHVVGMNVGRRAVTALLFPWRCRQQEFTTQRTHTSVLYDNVVYAREMILG